MYMSFREIIAEQKKPLEYKIEEAKTAIKNAYDHCKSKAAIAFSGGKDSTVLWHIIRTHFPEQQDNTAIIFGNTGVEYPESLTFARELGADWGKNNFFEAKPELLKTDGLKYVAQVQVLEYLVQTDLISKVLKADGKLKTTQALEKACPPEMRKRFEEEGLIWKAGAPKSYFWCVDQYGYPILGKAASKLKAKRINIDCFLRFSQSQSESEELQQYYNMLKKVKISQACCDILKKEPSEKIQAALKVDVIFKGLMAAESHSRKVNFATRGYLFQSKRKYIETPFFHCNPLSIWTDDDIWAYIHQFSVPYSPLYDIEYTNDKGKQCKIKRNGCTGCFTDYGRKNSHMYVLRQTHPGQWRSIMRYGMARQIQKLGSVLKKKKSLLSALDTATEEYYGEVLNWSIDNRPCAFD